MAQTVFARTEKKYRLSAEQREFIEHGLKGRMQPDSYGLSTICSIYYDTAQDDLIRRSISKPVYKEKLRIRSYGVLKSDKATVFIELKKKFNGTVFKRRVPISYKYAMRYMQTGIIPAVSGQDRQIMGEIDWARRFYSPIPRAFVGYDRIAYLGTDNDGFRLTFDSNIRCRDKDLNLLNGDYGTLILPKEESLLELKALGAMPLWMAHLLTEAQIYPQSFSKYGTYYIIKQSEEYEKCLKVYSQTQQMAN